MVSGFLFLRENGFSWVLSSKNNLKLYEISILHQRKNAGCARYRLQNHLFSCANSKKFESNSNFLTFNSGVIYLTKTLSPSGLVRKNAWAELPHDPLSWVFYTLYMHVVSPFLPHQNEYFKFIHFSSLQPSVTK